MKSYLLLAALLGQLAINVFLVARLHRYDNHLSAARLPAAAEQTAGTDPATIAAQVRQQVDKSLQQLARSEEFHAALGKILRDSLDNPQFAASVAGQNDNFVSDALQQSSASSALVETVYAETRSTISDAISAGVWTAEDSDVLTQNLAQLPAKQQAELMKVFVGAVNRQELRPEGNNFPF